MDDVLDIGDIDSAVADALGTKAPPSSTKNRLGVITITGSKNEPVEPAYKEFEDLTAEDIDSAVKNAIAATPPKTTVSGTVEKYLRQFGQQAAATADVMYGVVPSVVGLGAYTLARPFTSPEQAAKVQETVQSELDRPFGKAFGVTETAGYKGEPISNVMQYVGQNLDKGANWISKQTGMPVSDVQALMNEVLAASPGLKNTKTYQAIKSGVQAAGQNVGEAVGQATGIVRGQPTPAPRIEPTIGGVRPGAAPTTFGAQTAGAAQPTVRDFKSEITGIEGARGQYPQVKLSKTPSDVPELEQQTRAQILNDVMTNSGRKPGGQLRTGALTGNENTLRNEHAMARLAGEKQTPESEVLREQFANEQTALSDYAEQRVKNTGASDLLLSDAERGERINSAFTGKEGLTGVLDKAKSTLYDNVRNTVGNNPIGSTNIDSLLQNKQFRAGLGLKGNEGVARSAEELIKLAKTEGFTDELGNTYAPNTVNGWIAVQKSLNREWSPSNAGVIRQLNQAIERDIGAAGGLQTLKQADSLHQAEQQLFGSKGIKELFGEIDPNGVEKGTPFDKILPKLNTMPINQWRHVYGTAERIASGKLVGPIDPKTGMPKWTVDVPEDLRAAAQSALQEMRGGLAREIYQAGAGKAGEWNANSVNKVLNARGDKIREAFSPEEQQAFHNLNIAGHMMPGVHAYEGAAQQAARLGGLKARIPEAAAGLGATIGGGLAGMPGAGLGSLVGGKAGTKISETLTRKALENAANKRRQEMQLNAQKGTNPISGIVPPNP